MNKKLEARLNALNFFNRNKAKTIFVNIDTNKIIRKIQSHTGQELWEHANLNDELSYTRFKTLEELLKVLEHLQEE